MNNLIHPMWSDSETFKSELAKYYCDYEIPIIDITSYGGSINAHSTVPGEGLKRVVSLPLIMRDDNYRYYDIRAKHFNILNLFSTEPVYNFKFYKDTRILRSINQCIMYCDDPYPHEESHYTIYEL